MFRSPPSEDRSGKSSTGSNNKPALKCSEVHLPRVVLASLPLAAGTENVARARAVPRSAAMPAVLAACRAVGRAEVCEAIAGICEGFTHFMIKYLSPKIPVDVL